MHIPLCTTVAHNAERSGSDNIPPLPADNHRSSDAVCYGPITIAIRARFEHDSATTRYEMRTIRARLEHDTTSYEELCAFEQ